MRYLPIVFFLIILFVSCTPAKKLNIDASKKLDYSNSTYWAALPQKTDPADLTPDNSEPIKDGSIDIFFLYPTSFLSKKDRALWNAPIDYKKVNDITDKSSIKYQASIFNRVGNVYAPRYRQAHYYAYFTKDKNRAQEAFDLAYADVRDAFVYYLEHYNKNKPIIIAGHSQGSTHGMLLLKEFFDGKPLQQQLVAAYLPGMPITTDFLDSIPVCTFPEDINCIMSWRTYQNGYTPRHISREKPTIVVNPISWVTDTFYVDNLKHKGAVLRKFEGGLLPQRVDAKIQGNILWVHKPRFPGSFLYRSKNFHIADFNFFYLDVQQNAIKRRDIFLGKDKK